MSSCFNLCCNGSPGTQNSFQMVHPFLCDPRECAGYPPLLLFKEEPKNELNFLIECDGGKTLACSLIAAGDVDTDLDERMKIQDKLAILDRSKPIIVICHGMLSWRNQWLLANLASQLSTELSCHTLRFDFTGCGHSSGPWTYADYETDYQDLKQVEQFINSSLQCRIGCIVGHSQGSAAIIRHAYENDNCDMRPLYVNLAGRCFTQNSFDPKTKFKKSQCDELEASGSFTITKRGPRVFDVTIDAVRNRNLYDVKEFVKGVNHAQILTIHGDQDDMVPLENAHEFGELCKNHKLCIINGADHNFSGVKRIDEIVLSIASFLRKH